MNKKVLLFCLLVSITFVSFGQEKIKGNKNVTIIETELNPFNKIVVGEKFNITLVKNLNASIEIETDENLHDVIHFQVEDNTLTLKTTSRITSKKKLNITVKYADALDYIETKENGQLNTISTIESDSLIIKTFGNSKASLNLKTRKFKLINDGKSKLELNIESDFVDLELNANSKIEALITTDSLNVNLYESAVARIDGDTDYLNVNAINSSNFKGKDLTSKTCDLIAEDNSGAIVNVYETITIEASSKSNVTLYNNPEITLPKFTGSAVLRKKEL